MNLLDQQWIDRIEHPKPMQRIDMGEEFTRQILQRIPPPGSGLFPWIRSNKNHMLLVLIILINGISIGIGLRQTTMQIQQEKPDQQVTEVYFIDPSASQLFTYLK